MADVFPVCGFRVGFLDVGRRSYMALQYIVLLGMASYPRKHGHRLWTLADILFLAEVKTTSGFSRHLGFAHVCHKCHSRIRTPLSWTLKIAHWVSEIILRQPYSRKICTFHFGGRHLRFLADVDVTRYRKLHHWKAWHRKYGDSRWNFVAICSRIRDMPGGGRKNTHHLPANVAKNRCRDKG